MKLRIPAAITLVIFNTVILLAIFSFVAFTDQPQGHGANVASRNGDVNGDGEIDVSDAVYTLLYLFKNGDPPVAIADSPELFMRVEALESKVGDLEETDSVVNDELTIISGKVEILESEGADVHDGLLALTERLGALSTKLAFLYYTSGMNSHARWSHEDCQSQSQFISGDGYWKMTDQTAVIRNGTVSEEEIAFTTNRDTDLLFEFEHLGNRGVVTLDLDGSKLMSFSNLGTNANGLIRVFAFDVPEGEQSLKVSYDVICGAEGRVSAYATIKSIVVSYLD